uniref:Nucleic acid binding protein n=1 Tax=Solanum tuberosum TaxID=4113 RepID=M1CXY7_SOLTU
MAENEEDDYMGDLSHFLPPGASSLPSKTDLLNTLMRLRDEYHYCLFCGCQYESTEALQSNCPGITEDDH